MKRFRKKLPAGPSGYEYLDLLWLQLIPAAASYLAVLPRSADPAWATERGLRFVAISLLQKWAASDELQRTPNQSTLRRVRKRHLHLMEKQYLGQALTFVGALVDQAAQAASESVTGPALDGGPRRAPRTVAGGLPRRRSRVTMTNLVKCTACGWLHFATSAAAALDEMQGVNEILERAKAPTGRRRRKRTCDAFVAALTLRRSYLPKSPTPRRA